MKIESKAMLKQLIWACYVKCYNQISIDRDKLQDVVENHEEYVIQNCALIEMDIQNYYYYKALWSALSVIDSAHVVTGKRHLLNSMEQEFKNRRKSFIESLGFTASKLIYPLSFADVFKHSFEDFVSGSTPLDFCNLILKRIEATKL